jgi:hypothetical protein
MIQQKIQHRRFSLNSISISSLQRANKDRVPTVSENSRFSLPFAKAVGGMNDPHSVRRD